ncbi:MAG: endonuclease IV, partial [candidate division Zixibacteria bacterium SM23_73]
IIELVKENQRLGVCYDTCHTFAAGYDIRGLEGFRLLMNDKRWAKTPKILETPKEGGTAKDIKNLSVLRRLGK